MMMTMTRNCDDDLKFVAEHDVHTRKRLEAEIAELMSSRTIAVSLLKVLHDENQIKQRHALQLYAEMLCSPLVRCYLDLREDFLCARDAQERDAVVKQIRNSYFVKDAPNPIVLTDEKVTSLILSDNSSETMSKVASEVLNKIRKARLFHFFLAYLVDHDLVSNIPSLKDCLGKGEISARFFEFCRTCNCEHLVSFLNDVADFESYFGSSFETHHEASAICANYLEQNDASSFGSQFASPIFELLDSGNANRAMFKPLAQSVERVLKQDIWPFFIADGVEDETPGLSKLFYILKDSAGQAESSSGGRRKLSSSFEVHPLFDKPSSLRFLRLPRPKFGFAEIIFTNNHGGDFTATVKDSKLVKMLVVEELDSAEVKALINCFCLTQEGKYVAHFTATDSTI